MSDESIGQQIDPLAHPSELGDELSAMQWIVEGFEPLDNKARQRVLDWARSRYGDFVEAITMDLVAKLLEAVAAHRDASTQESEADKTLYNRTIDSLMKTLTSMRDAAVEYPSATWRTSG